MKDVLKLLSLSWIICDVLAAVYLELVRGQDSCGWLEWLPNWLCILLQIQCSTKILLLLLLEDCKIKANSWLLWESNPICTKGSFCLYFTKSTYSGVKFIRKEPNKGSRYSVSGLTDQKDRRCSIGLHNPFEKEDRKVDPGVAGQIVDEVTDSIAPEMSVFKFVLFLFLCCHRLINYILLQSSINKLILVVVDIYDLHQEIYLIIDQGHSFHLFKS